MRRARFVVLMAVVLVCGAASGCGGSGSGDDAPIRYPHLTQPAPAPRAAVPAWVPKRLAGRVEHLAGLGACDVVYGDQEIDRAPPGGCRTALEVVAEFDDKFGDTAICDQDACPPRTHVVRGWRCRLSSWFDDAYTFTCRRHGHVISFSGGG